MPAPRTLYLTTSDGLNLRTLVWDHVEPRAVIALVHGLGEHLGRYAHVADYFNQKGYALLAYDQRGHGESGGPRGHSPSYEALTDDLALFLRKVEKEYPDTPVVLFGHSMGGNVVLNYVLQRKTNLRGMIISSPFIDLAFSPPAWKVKLAGVLTALFPKLSMANELDVQGLSRNPQVVQAYINDPLVHNKITSSLIYNLMRRAAWLRDYRAELPIPTLLYHGTDDRLTSHPASKAFAAQVSGPITFVEFPGFYHEIHNEPEQEQLFEQIHSWLNGVLG